MIKGEGLEVREDLGQAVGRDASCYVPDPSAQEGLED